MPLARVLCVLLLGLLAGWPAQGKEYRSSDIYPADYPTVQAVVQMDKLLRERSGGRQGITMLEHGLRDTEAETVAHLRDGTLDMARLNISMLEEGTPLVAALSAPFLFKSTTHARRIFDGPVGDEVLAALQSQGLVGLCLYDAGPRSFYSVAKPIRAAADLKGLRVRVQQSPAWTAMMRGLGALPQTMPFEHVYPALQAGTLDAAENNWPSYVASRHYTLAGYFSRTEHSMAPAVLVFSKRTWDELTPQDQALVRSAARDSLVTMRRLWDQYDRMASKAVETAGGQVVADVDKASFADALQAPYPAILDDKQRGLVRRIQNED
jgi:tripartite ATP-independent transporter DctP family solute receptor